MIYSHKRDDIGARAWGVQIGRAYAEIVHAPTARWLPDIECGWLWVSLHRRSWTAIVVIVA